MLLFRNRAHSSPALLLLDVSGGLMIVVLPPTEPRFAIAVEVSDELS
jgi:hypothetical protein